MWRGHRITACLSQPHAAARRFAHADRQWDVGEAAMRSRHGRVNRQDFAPAYRRKGTGQRSSECAAYGPPPEQHSRCAHGNANEECGRQASVDPGISSSSPCRHHRAFALRHDLRRTLGQAVSLPGHFYPRRRRGVWDGSSRHFNSWKRPALRHGIGSVCRTLHPELI
jgi:hypothetical protein